MSEYQEAWKSALAEAQYSEGEILARQGSYRHKVVTVGFPDAPNRGIFADGVEGAYSSFIRLTRADGSHLYEGGAIVPILPDGRILMIIERRPAQGLVADRAHSLRRDDGSVIDLRDYGPYSSLEFVSGGANVKEPIGRTLLRELEEETNADRGGRLYLGPWYYPQGSDLALRNRSAVIFLTGFGFSPHVNNDGGLHVLALSRSEVQRAFRQQVVVAAQAGVIPWDWYRQVEEVRQEAELEAELVSEGYLEIHDVKF